MTTTDTPRTDALIMECPSYLQVVYLANLAMDLERELNEAKAELEEIKETYASIVQQPHFDEREVHCSCVPALRAEVERLRVYLARSVEIAMIIWGDKTCDKPWPELRAELDQLKATLNP